MKSVKQVGSSEGLLDEPIEKSEEIAKTEVQSNVSEVGEVMKAAKLLKEDTKVDSAIDSVVKSVTQEIKKSEEPEQDEKKSKAQENFVENSIEQALKIRALEAKIARLEAKNDRKDLELAD